MKRAFSTLCCLSYNIEEIFSLAQGARMDGIELRLDMPKVRAWHEDDEIYARIRQWPSEGLVVTDVAASISITQYDERMLQDAMLCIDVAEGIGAGAVRVFAGAHRKYFSEKVGSDMDGIVQLLKELCDYAKDKNVEIWLETHSDFSTGRAVRKVIDAVDRSNMKALWDVMHSLEFGESMEKSLEALGDCLAHVHWKDGRFSGDPDLCEYIHTDLGEGQMPLKELLQILKEHRYDGYVSLEWESPWRAEIRDLYPDPADLLKKYNCLLDEVEEESI